MVVSSNSTFLLFSVMKNGARRWFKEMTTYSTFRHPVASLTMY